MTIFELNRLLAYDDEALIVELKRVASLIKTPYMTEAAFDKVSKASSSLIRRRFGGWQQALGRADLAERYSGTAASRKLVAQRMRSYSDEELLTELRRVSDKLGGKPVTVTLFNKHATMGAETVRQRFGSWWAALKKADLVISNLGKRYSDEDYFENLLTVWTHHGRQPKYNEMDEAPSWIPSGAYEAKWRTWRKALLAFLKRVNQDPPQEDLSISEEEPKHTSQTVLAGRDRRAKPRRIKKEDDRQIRLGLRYEVLKRDNFRCVLCGASPAINLRCVLHVDHIIPYSKEGKTVAENLRTLCEKCNLGKGNKAH